jgi:hypothetical protein
MELVFMRRTRAFVLFEMILILPPEFSSASAPNARTPSDTDECGVLNKLVTDRWRPMAFSG